MSMGAAGRCAAILERAVFRAREGWRGLGYAHPAMIDPTTDPMPLWRAAALLRCELKHGEPENEVQAQMLAHFCERAAWGDETAQVVVEVMEPELRAVLARLSV